MKVVLDLDRLLAHNEITEPEYRRLMAFAAAETGSLAFNILIGFGVVATALGALTLMASATASIVLGGVLAYGGIQLRTQHLRKWGVLGGMLLVVGTLMVIGGIVAFTKAGVAGFFLVAALCFVGGIAARSGLLMATSVLALSTALGAGAAYSHALYSVNILHPAVTVTLFTVLAWLAYRVSLKLEPHHERLALIFSRTCLFLVNLGFWVGSLWGDGSAAFGKSSIVPQISQSVFVLGWAAALIATGVWAARQGRRWVVNLCAVFGSIHFYTQYFEYLKASAGSILVAGLVALGIALSIRRYNTGATA